MSSRGSKHTIFLLQKTPSKNSKTFQDFETVSAAMNALCQMFEQRLQHENPGKSNITYDVSELIAYIRGMNDVCALVLDPEVGAYRPQNKDWVCSRLYSHLKSAAGRG